MSDNTRKGRRNGHETTHYENDPLRGDKQAHAIARKLRNHHSPRTIAKHLGVSVERVKDVADRVQPRRTRRT